MNKKLKIILFTILTCATLPIIFVANFITRNDAPKSVKITENIQKRVMKELAQKYHMEPSVTVFGMPEGIVREIGAGFRIYRPLTKDEIRLIMVNSIQSYIDAVNANNELRPFLKDDPFTDKNVSVTLFFFQKDGNTLYDPEIGVATIEHGSIRYFTNDPENPYKYKSESEESYDEAAQIVASQAAYKTGVKLF